MKRLVSKTLLLLLISSFSLGFRIMWDNPMDVSKSSPRLYLKLCAADQSKTFGGNSVDSGDELYNQASIDAIDALYSIVNDYNNVASSYLVLVIFGDTNEDGVIDGSDDSSHDSISTKKLVDLCAGSSGGLAAAGEAQIDPDGGCEITFSDDLFDNVRDYVATLTHEIGHCVGLAHPQELGDEAIMSYWAGSDVYRLQIDDKLGVTELYPIEKLQESTTFGLSCDAK